jgi:hypothetical protein
MKKQVLLGILIMVISFAYCQNQTDTITVVKKTLGAAYQLDGKYLSIRQISNVVKPNHEAFKLMKQVKTANFFSSLLAYSGGFMIGWPIGTAIAGGEPEWQLAGIGVGLLGAGIAISSTSNKKITKAVTLYNNDLKGISLRREEVKIEFADNGLGIKIVF